MPLIRNGSMRALDLGAMTEIVTFPSFHAASAAIYLWALWPVKLLRPIAILANVAMIAATPAVGGHYSSMSSQGSPSRPHAAMRRVNVSKCCWASTVVGTSTATCLPS